MLSSRACFCGAARSLERRGMKKGLASIEDDRGVAERSEVAEVARGRCQASDQVAAFRTAAGVTR